MGVNHSNHNGPAESLTKRCPTNCTDLLDEKASSDYKNDGEKSIHSEPLIVEFIQEPSALQVRQHKLGLNHSANITQDIRNDAVETLSHIQPLRSRLFHDLVSHDYVLPHGGPIHATIAEVISILPCWFRNVDMARRFLNNGITGRTHLAILEKHRHLEPESLIERKRAQDLITDHYRKTLRWGVDPRWTKANHKAPENWDSLSIQINEFVPDAVCQAKFEFPAPIVFSDLAKGMKKLPQGDDAADLTRALDYAMHHKGCDASGRSVDFMFPTHLQAILDHIGRTVITEAHSDPAVIMRYVSCEQAAAAATTTATTITRAKREQKRPARKKTGAKDKRETFSRYHVVQVQVSSPQAPSIDPTQTNPVPQSIEQDAAAIVASKLIDQQIDYLDRLLDQPPDLTDPCSTPELNEYLEEFSVYDNNDNKTEAESQEIITVEEFEALIASHQSMDFSFLDPASVQSEFGHAQSFDFNMELDTFK